MTTQKILSFDPVVGGGGTEFLPVRFDTDTQKIDLFDGAYPLSFSGTSVTFNNQLRVSTLTTHFPEGPDGIVKAEEMRTSRTYFDRDGTPDKAHIIGSETIVSNWNAPVLHAVGCYITLQNNHMYLRGLPSNNDSWHHDWQHQIYYES